MLTFKDVFRNAKMLNFTDKALLGLKQLKGFTNPVNQFFRFFVQGRNGLVLGAWEKDGKMQLTEEASLFNDSVQGKLEEKLKDVRMHEGQVEVVHDLGHYYAVVVSCIGPFGLGFNEQERLHEAREFVRKAAARGVNEIVKQEVCRICMDPMACAEGAAEGAILAKWLFQEYKTHKRVERPEINMFGGKSKDKDLWDRGVVMAEAQNTARQLTEKPGNRMTPRIFAEESIRILCPCGVQVQVRPLVWLEANKMFSFLNMAKGSCEPPYLLEVSYCGGKEDDRPVLLIGKGVTFDSGGYCLKFCSNITRFDSTNMTEERGANTGASSIVGAIQAIAKLGIPVNVIGLLPLFENMISGSAIKPGDVVMALDGRTIVVEDTDHEGRVALADILIYSDKFTPCLDVVIGNLSVGSRAALGNGATPVFSTSQVVWDELEKAGAFTGDRVWRMPLWKQYKRRTTSCSHVDVCNAGQGFPRATPCLAAAFLKEFVPGCDYLHLDTTGTGLTSRGFSKPYYRKGFMTGRPTRTIAQFINNMGCPLDQPVTCST